MLDTRTHIYMFGIGHRLLIVSHPPTHCSVGTLDGGLRLAEVKVAGDGTRKMVLEITSGPGTHMS